MIPDFAAVAVAGTLEAIEAAVETYEQARQSGARVDQAAQEVRPDIASQGAIRWVKRRILWVRAVLMMLMGCCPDVLQQRELTVMAARDALGAACVLVRAREIAAPQLPRAASPVGFRRGRRLRSGTPAGVQHPLGPDPPS